MRLTIFIILTLCSCANFAAEVTCSEVSSPPGTHHGETLRVATLNIAHGRGGSLNQMLIGKSRIERNIDTVGVQLAAQDAHVVALQELDVDSLWAGGFDHAARLMEGGRMNCAVLGLHAQTWLYRFGTGLLSEILLTEPRVIDFEPTPPTTTKGLVSATMNWRQGEQVKSVRIASVHLDFSRKKARKRQLADIISAINESTVPIIVMGDFNEQWSSQDSVLRHLVEEAGMKAYQPESEDLPTYKSKRLDWILVSRELEFVSYQVVGEEVSDHRMVTAELRWSSES
ncbi:MAG: endonuclease/exonuclease/phosphatase family protein [Halioglobus sp.]